MPSDCCSEDHNSRHQCRIHRWDQFWYDDKDEAVKDAAASWNALSLEDKKKYQYNVSVEYFDEDGEMVEREDVASFYYKEERKPRHHDSEDPWYIIRGIMGSNCVKTDSDAGALKVKQKRPTPLIFSMSSRSLDSWTSTIALKSWRRQWKSSTNLWT